jgi:hypothetical protein
VYGCYQPFNPESPSHHKLPPFLKVAYVHEITGRTEQYFCPIKHARKILNAHSRYKRFLEYGEADNFHGKLEDFEPNSPKKLGKRASRKVAARTMRAAQPSRF